MKYLELVGILFMILCFITLWLKLWLWAYYNNKRDEE